MPRTGQLKEVIDVYAPRRTERPGGQKVVELVRSFAGLRAEVTDVRGREVDRHAQQVAVHTHRVRIRSRTVDVRPDMVLVWVNAGGQRMEIAGHAPLTGEHTDFTVLYTNTVQDHTPLVVDPA